MRISVLAPAGNSANSQDNRSTLFDGFGSALSRRTELGKVASTITSCAAASLGLVTIRLHSHS